MVDIEFISVGDEIVSGTTEDRNFSFAAREFVGAGMSPPKRRISVGDSRKDIVSALRSSGKADFTIVCGGLGPTPDDLTLECAADFLGEPLARNTEALRHVKNALKKMKRNMLPAHKKQAMAPENAKIIPNPNGVSPGFVCESKGAVFYFLPGVPGEFRHIITDFVVPDVLKRSGEESFSFSLRAVGIFGIPESELAQKMEKMKITNVETAYRIISSDEIQVRVFHDKDPELVDRTAEQIKEHFGENAFSKSGERLAEAVAQTLREKNLTVATAESCTAGGLSSTLTDMAGSSVYFPGGVAAYSNGAKSEILGIDPGIIEKNGAVSDEVARAMAEGAKKRFGSDIGVGITGIAGPGGGSVEKPVGTVYIATDAGENAGGAVCVRYEFRGNRARIRERSVSWALFMIMKSALRFPRPGA